MRLTTDPTPLSAVRLAHGWTILDLSAAAQVSIGHLSEIERGVHRAGPSIVKRLAGAFGLGERHVQKLCNRTYSQGSPLRRKEKRRARRRGCRSD